MTLGDRRNMAYMGSTVAYGRGRMVVTATGMDTEMGKIAGVLARTEQEETPPAKEADPVGQDPVLAGAGHLRVHLRV